MAPAHRVIAFLLLSVWTIPAAAQETDQPQTLPHPADTSAADTTGQVVGVLGPPADTLLADPEAVRPPPTRSGDGGLDETVQFSATDSLIIQFDEDGDVGSLFGNARVVSGDATLQAYQVDILFEIDELRARGLRSDTGFVGRPQFSQGSESFTGTELAFNLETERGRVVEAQTGIEEGFIRAGVVKVDRDSVIYIANGVYTTCECVEDPSYTLRSDKMKIVDQEWIYTGPIQLYIFNIPTPLWLPFGFLPAREGRRSGPLPPQYGEDERGFYLRNWGWYQAISEYLDAQVQFGLWTKGSWQVSPQMRYARRYRYRGSVGFDYVRNRSGERGDPTFSAYGTGRIRWNHNQELSPTSRLNADVDLSSSSYLRTSSEQYDDRVRQTIQSSIGYSKNWRSSGRSLSLNSSHRQNLANRSVNITLPSLRFTQSTRTPFARERAVGGQRWYERIQYDYSGSLENRYAFVPSLQDSAAADISWYEALFSPSKYRRATGRDQPFDFRASHRVGSSASFSINRIPVINKRIRLNLAPNLNYTEDWFIQTTERRLDPDSTVAEVTNPGFFALRQFTTGVSANTTFYGLFPVAIGPFQGLRHTVRPSVSFSYRPDFYDDFWGYTDTYVDANGNVVRYARVSGVSQGKQKALSLSVDNVFETKHVRVDTTGETRSRTVPLLNVSANTSYNFAREEFKLAPINVTARTRIAEQFNLRMSSTFSPYALDESRSAEIDRYLISGNFLTPVRLTRANISLNTRFQSARRGESRPYAPPGMTMAGAPLGPPGQPGLDMGDPLGAGGTPYYNTSLGYADFAIPWSLTLDITYNYQFLLATPGQSAGPDHTATINTGFDFNLTPNWKVQGRSGYDFERQELVYTSLSILRDFECWEMAINWVPFGPYQSYSFDLHVKSGALRDILRLRQPREDVRGRFSNLLN